MLRRAVGYAYPWDYDGDPDAAARAAALGVDTVAVAASYHVTRASTPLHPVHRVVEATRAACYVPVRPEAWRGHRLVPTAAGRDGEDSPFGDAHRQLTACGLGVDAWVVLTHNSTLGAAHPELVVRNAFGDSYPYALCPAQDDVVEYCRTLVAEVVAAAPLSGVVLEACGPMGLDHGGHHDKVELAGWDAVRRTLLSLCFCTACRERYAGVGLDGARLAGQVRDVVDGDGTAATVEECLGAGQAAAVAGVRTGIARELRALLVATCRSAAPGLRVTVHGSSDPWATGSFSTLQPAVGDGVDSVVANCWDVAAGADRIAALRTLAPSSTGVGAYLRLDRGWPAGEGTERRLQDYIAAGAGELHLYHLGLLGRAGLAAMAGVVGAARRAVRASPASRP